MSRPEPRLITKILSLPAVQALGITEMYPLKIPAHKPYPGIVYQVVRDWPNDPADGRAHGHFIQIRVTCLAKETTGVPGYKAIRTLATAVVGDMHPHTEPTGIAGWYDTEDNVWLLDESSDSMGTIIDGTDQFEAYAIDLFFRTTYTL